MIERLLLDLHKKNKENIVEEVTVKMIPIGPVFLGKPLIEDSQASKYLFQLFCDGVRELTLKLARFLSVSTENIRLSDL